MEKFISPRVNKGRKTYVKQKGEGKLSNFNVLKVKSCSEDDAWRLNMTGPEMYFYSHLNSCTTFTKHSRPYKEVSVSYPQRKKLLVGEGGRENNFQV